MSEGTLGAHTNTRAPDRFSARARRNGRRAPPASVPTIALARPGTAFATPPAVLIPIGTPGLDHAGHVLRGDAIVALRLDKLRDSGLPSVAEVVVSSPAIGRLKVRRTRNTWRVGYALWV